MATIKFKYLKGKKSYNLHITFQAKSGLKYKDPDYFQIPIQYFDKKNNGPKISYPNYKKYTARFKELEQIKDDLLYDVQFNKSITAIELKKMFIDRMLGEDKKVKKEVLFIEHGNAVVKRTGDPKVNSTAGNLYYALQKFSQYRLDQDIAVSEITYNMLLDFKSYCLESIIESTVSLYITKLQFIFTDAVDQYDLTLKSPFKKGLMKNIVYPHRNLDLEDLKYLLNLEGLNDRQQLTIDLKMLSFYMRGLDIVDIITIEKIYKNRVTLQRAKMRNKQSGFVSIFLEPEAIEIINKYKVDDNIYIFPFLTVDFKSEEGKAQWKTFHSKMRYNRNTITKKHGIDFKFSFKVIRHTWSSIARSIDIQYDVIKACLGHKNTDVTSIYIAYDDKQLDQANRKVLDLLK